MAHRELENFLKGGTTTSAKRTTWKKQSQNMKNSTKGGFSFRNLIPIINILPNKKKKIKSCQRVSFILRAEKERSKQKGNNPKIKFSLETVTIPSPTFPSLERYVIYKALLCRKLFLGSSGREPREGEKETQAQKGEERKKENGAETKSRPSTRRLSRVESGPGKAARGPSAGDSGSPLPPLGRAVIWGGWGPEKGGPGAARWEQWGR